MTRRKVASVALAGLGLAFGLWAVGGNGQSGSRPPEDTAVIARASWDNDTEAPIAPIYSNPQTAELGIAGRQGILLEKEGYFVINYSPEWKIPLWVAECLNWDDLKGKAKRGNDFRPDPELPESLRSELSDYRKSGYDRGHCAPAGDFTRNKRAMSLTFLLSNMSPQTPKLNRGEWQEFESAVRDSVKKYGRAWIVTGNLLKGNTLYIGKNRVAVPDFLFKVILCLGEDGKYRGFAGLGDNSPHNPKVLFLPIDEIETLSGFDFFCLLPSEIQEKIEARR